MTDIIEAMAEAMAEATEALYGPIGPSASCDYAQIVRSVVAAAAERGYVLVPKEATPEMIAEGHLRDPLGCDVDSANDVYPVIWQAMIAAGRVG